MHVLITSAGRRTSLLEAFRRHASERGGRVLAGDRDPLAPALYLADAAVVLPPIGEESYVDDLIDLVDERQIELIVPTIDTELSVLAATAPRFASHGCTALISSPELVEIAGDKWRTFQAFAERGIATPQSWRPEDLPAKGLPERLFVKPRQGSASQHTLAVGREGLGEVLGRVPDPLVQECIDAPEITIDALLGLDGRPLHYVPRLRIRTLAGESIQGVTLPDADLRDWLVGVLEQVADLGGRGPITLQAFLTARGPVLIEINPRFGGGFPLTYAAGGHYPEWILRELEGKTLPSMIGAYRVGLHMTRSYREQFVSVPIAELASAIPGPTGHTGGGRP